MNKKYLTENERMYYKNSRTIANCEIAIVLLILVGVLLILFYLLETATGSQYRGSTAHDPISAHQVYRPGHMTMINGKASNVAGPVSLVTLVKKAIPIPGDGLLFQMPAKKSIFDVVLDSRPFESRQPMNPNITNIGPCGCLFWALSDQWQFLQIKNKPLPRGCNHFIERFLSDSAVIIDRTSQASRLELCGTILASHSDYYSGIAL